MSLKDESTIALGHKLNELIKRSQQVNMDRLQLEKEWNEVVYELWNRIPSLTHDVNLQPERGIENEKAKRFDRMTEILESRMTSEHTQARFNSDLIHLWYVSQGKEDEFLQLQMEEMKGRNRS